VLSVIVWAQTLKWRVRNWLRRQDGQTSSEYLVIAGNRRRGAPGDLRAVRRRDPRGHGQAGRADPEVLGRPVGPGPTPPPCARSTRGRVRPGRQAGAALRPVHGRDGHRPVDRGADRLRLIHLSMLAVTRHVCNLAAFSGARAAVYGGTGACPERRRPPVRSPGPSRRARGSCPRGRPRRLPRAVDSPFGYPLTARAAGPSSQRWRRCTCSRTSGRRATMPRVDEDRSTRRASFMATSGDRRFRSPSRCSSRCSSCARRHRRRPGREPAGLPADRGRRRRVHGATEMARGMNTIGDLNLWIQRAWAPSPSRRWVSP